ncbi:MAG TPA: DNA circularization N-terminal domain-containing protein [Methanosarcinales archaeon]|nr:DNA circularization N-terminal domain-containing protein [Methanosarcinales archaeon]
MFLYDRLYVCSFKGVNLLWESFENEDGRKWITHEFPGKDVGKNEDIGKKTRRFKGRVYLSGEVGGIFYKENREELLTAFIEPKSGIFVHPIIGGVNCVALPFSLKEDQTQLGYALCDITFVEDEKTQFPEDTGKANSIIAKLYDELYKLCKDYLKLRTYYKYVEIFLEELQRISNLYDLVSGIAATASSIVGDLQSAFQTNISNAQDKRFQTTADTDALADSITGTASDFDGLFEDAPYERLQANSNAFGIGLNEDDSNPVTDNGRENQQNRDTFNGVVNSLFLANIYSSILDIDYETTEDIDNVSDQLASYYKSILQDKNVSLSKDMINTISNMHVAANSFLRDSRSSAKNINTITVLNQPLAVVVYGYYGSTELYEEIKQLNNIHNPELVNGEIKILVK